MSTAARMAGRALGVLLLLGAPAAAQKPADDGPKNPCGGPRGPSNPTAKNDPRWDYLLLSRADSTVVIGPQLKARAIEASASADSGKKGDGTCPLEPPDPKDPKPKPFTPPRRP